MGPAGRISVRMKIIRRLAAACVAILPWTSSRHADAAAPLVLANRLSLRRRQNRHIAARLADDWADVR